MSPRDVLQWISPPDDATNGQLSRWRDRITTAVFILFLNVICLYLITVKASDLAEHARAPHETASEAIDAIKRETRCQSIDIQIRLVDQAIWQMEESGRASARLVEKRRDLQNLIDQRRALKCSEFD